MYIYTSQTNCMSKQHALFHITLHPRESISERINWANCADNTEGNLSKNFNKIFFLLQFSIYHHHGRCGEHEHVSFHKIFSNNDLMCIMMTVILTIMKDILYSLFSYTYTWLNVWFYLLLYEFYFIFIIIVNMLIPTRQWRVAWR